VGSPVEVKTLAAIQKEVAFPVPSQELTPGMAYALKTYGRDGWGKEFRFESLSSNRYVIACAGADGVHGSADDIDLLVPLRATREDDWELLVNGVYVRQVDRQDMFFVHRVEHRHFRQAHRGEARTLTDTDLFDVFDREELIGSHVSPRGEHAIVTALKEWRESRSPAHGTEPLLFVQILWEEKND
jgi:hypothetical protein